MKKMCLVLAVMMLASSAFSAEVLSQNAVGFISIPMEAGALEALTYPFNDATSAEAGIAWTNTPIAKEAAYGSVVYFWTGSNWTQSTFNESFLPGVIPDEWDGRGASYVLQSGEAFFYRPAAAQTVLISGEVPDDAKLEVVVAKGGNLSAVGNPYPTPIKFKDSAFATNAAYGATAYFWTGSNWTQSTYNESFLPGVIPDEWDGRGETEVIQPGRGIFFRTVVSDGDITNVYVRPYSWPKPADEN